jgi:hypothetical protein
MKTAHPKSWFIARIGKRIERVKPVLKGNPVVTIEDEFHATYLYEVQCEAGYRYEEVKLVHNIEVSE